MTETIATGERISPYRYRKVGNKYFVTTDFGSSCFLSEEELENLKQENIDENLRKKLEATCILLNERTMDEAVRLTRNRYSFLFTGASLHIIVVTLRCNMNCVYCHAASEAESKIELDMTIETAKKTVDFIFQSPSKGITIEFQGGEPLLNWEAIKCIIEYAKEKNKEANKDLHFALVSNLTRMDEEKMDYLMRQDVGICTSLDGHKELHDRNRSLMKGSSHEFVVNWIQKINEEYEKRGIGKRVGALVTLTKKSLAHPKEIVDEYVRLGLNVIHLRFLNNLGAAKKTWRAISYPIEDYLTFWREAVSYIEELQKKGVDIQERMVSIMSRKIGSEFDPGYLDLRNPCGDAMSQMTYGFNGDIYTCDEARMLGEDTFKLGNVHENNYKEMATSDKACAIVAASVNDQYICNTCAYKPFCGLCPVISYAENGTIITKVSQSSRCKIFKSQFDWVVEEKFLKKEISS